MVAARLNTDLKEVFYKLQKADPSLASRGTEWSQSFSEVTLLSGELKKAVDGNKSAEASLASRDSYLAKVSKLRDSALLKLAAECVQSSESAGSVAGVTASVGRFRQQLTDPEEK